MGSTYHSSGFGVFDLLGASVRRDGDDGDMADDGAIPL